MKMMYNDKIVYMVVIWMFFWISLWKEKEALNTANDLIIVQMGWLLYSYNIPCTSSWECSLKPGRIISV